MTVAIVSKRKSGLVCGVCKTAVPEDTEECAEHGDENIKKSLVVIRKAVGDDEDDLDGALDSDDVNEDEDEDLDDDDDGEDEEDEDEEEDDDEEEDEEEDEDDDDDDDDDDADDQPVTKSVAGIEALNISTAFAEDIAKVFSSNNPSRAEYENLMNDLNNMVDAAAENWFSGQGVSKSVDHEDAIDNRVNGLFGRKKGKKMAGKSNLKNLKGKKAKPFSRDDLPEDVKKSLKDADEIVENNTKQRFKKKAEEYADLGGINVEKLAKSFRTLSETDEDAYKDLLESLDAAKQSAAQGEIFKSFGRTGGGETKDAAQEEAISKHMAANSGMTREQAMVDLMDGSAYKPTAV